MRVILTSRPDKDIEDALQGVTSLHVGKQDKQHELDMEYIVRKTIVEEHLPEASEDDKAAVVTKALERAERVVASKKEDLLYLANSFRPCRHHALLQLFHHCYS